MAQTVHTARKDDRLTLSDRLQLWASVPIVALAIIILTVIH